MGFYDGLLGTVIGGGISIITLIITRRSSYRKWRLERQRDRRTDAILDAYDTFIDSHTIINISANRVLSSLIKPRGVVRIPLDKEVKDALLNYHQSVMKLDLWVEPTSRKELRKVLGTFRKFSQVIWEVGDEKLHSKDWEQFENTRNIVKKVVKRELARNLK